MKTSILFVILVITLWSCMGKIKNNAPKPSAASIIGTWQLIKGVVIQENDTVVTDYTKKISFIKIINETHFAFLQHDLTKGKDSGAVFVSGGGRYSLRDSMYTEHLEYCSDRNWEGNDFKFTISIKNDTLTQSGVEKIEKAGVNRINIEKYIKVK